MSAFRITINIANFIQNKIIKMIDIENATHKELLEEWERCEELWEKYSCDCFGFYMNHLHTAITNKGGWI